MAATERSAFHNFQGFLDAMTGGLHKVRRWTHYEHAHPEDGVDHAFKGAILAMAMLALERANRSAADLDGERILGAAVTHDIGEWLLGDVRLQVKSDPRVREQLREIEQELFTREILSPLPSDVAGALEHASDLQDDHASPSGRFFNAVERIGYIIYALKEYREGREHFVAVFARQHGALQRLGEEFFSVRTIYGALREEIEAALETPDGRKELDRYATRDDVHETIRALAARSSETHEAS